MSSSEEETYSTIFASLRHPIRRRILRILSEGPRSFSEMQKVFRIESSHLTYHLESLGNLLFKTEDGKYTLSSLGEAAVSMMNQVEEPPKAPLRLPLPSKRWKALSVALMVGLILLSGFLYFQSQTLSQLSSQYLSLKEEHELLQEVLREALDLGNAVLTYEYAVNGSVATALVRIINETGVNITFMIITSRLGDNIDSYSIYSLTGNSTLEMEISFPSPDQPGAYLSVWVSKEIRVLCRWCNGTVVCDADNGTTTRDNFSDLIAYKSIWGKRVTNSSTCSVVLPSRGWYFIRIGVPSVSNATDHYRINYTVTLRVKGKRNHIPFFVGSRTGGFGPIGFFGGYDWLHKLLESYGDP